jgi:SAM-dependent methyltransferase
MPAMSGGEDADLNAAASGMLDRCDLCGSGRPFLVLASEAPDRYRALVAIGLNDETYTTVMCRNCGWVFKPGVLTDRQVTALYQLHGGEKTMRGDLSLARVRSRKVYDFVARGMDLGTTVRVLDVGGGRGQVSLVFAEHGHTVDIVDMAESTPLHPSMQVHHTTLDHFRGGAPFDVVLLSHVLEHVWSPTQLINLGLQAARPGGCVYVEVPFELYTPLIKRKLGDPCHVGYFARHTLLRLLENAGLTPVAVERSLGHYNARRVMVLRALARRSAVDPQRRHAGPVPGDLRTVAEMFHPTQVAHAIASMYFRFRRPKPH